MDLSDAQLRRQMEEAILRYQGRSGGTAEKKRLECAHCKKTFAAGSEMEHEQHQWMCDPKPDPFVAKWRATDFSQWKGSTFYREDPYY